MVPGAVVGWFVCVVGKAAQPKYAPDLMLEIHGVALSSTGRLAVGMPNFLEPRPKPLITLPAIRRG